MNTFLAQCVGSSNIKTMMKSVIILVLYVLLVASAPSVPKKWRILAKKWAPMVWLPKGEKYLPSSVPFFFKHTKLSTQHKSSLSINNIPKCSSNCYLESKEKLKTPTSTLKFFEGQASYKVPVYTVVKRLGPITEIHYWFFYPYNLGKRVCVGLKLRKICFCPWRRKCCKKVKTCLGGKKRFGSHVGDWESVKVKFFGYSPFALVIASHGKEQVFTRKNGKYENKKEKFKIQFFGTHPVIYSALGSHGSWSSDGKHVYKTLANNVQLIDECSKGTKWRTWRNIVIGMHDPTKNYRKSPLGFLRFQGRWGNKKRGCKLYEKLFGVCTLNNGPKGPAKAL